MKLKNKNKWKSATAIISILCVIMLAIYIDGIQRDKEFDYQEDKTPKELCLDATGTPAWVIGDGHNGNVILGYGYKGNLTEDGTNLVDFLINNQIYFLYTTRCGWCQKQVQDFGEDWIRYFDSGLTINCAE